MIAISTKGHEWQYAAATGHEAVQMFFDDIKSGKIDIYNLGLIGEWTDGAEPEPYAFRIGPALNRIGLLSDDDLAAVHEAAELGFTPEQLRNMAQADAWMVRQGPMPGSN